MHEELIQKVLSETLLPRVLLLCQHSILAGHSGLNRMYYHIRNVYYWPHLTAEVPIMAWNVSSCALICVKLMRHTNYLTLFTATKPLQSFSIDILGRLSKST